MLELERVKRLGDDVLIERLTRSVQRDRQLSVELLIELSEVEERRLFRDLGFSTMFDYATRRLGMSESEASLRLRAAKVARAFPIALEMLRRCEIHLTTLSLLAPVLTADRLQLLHEARFKTKQQVQELVAKYAPKPDVPDSIRRMPRPSPGVRLSSDALQVQDGCSTPLLVPSVASTPTRATVAEPGARLSARAPQFQNTSLASDLLRVRHPLEIVDAFEALAASTPQPMSPTARTTAGEVLPLSPNRYKISFTASQRVRDMLEEARELRRHRDPTGQLEPLFERALELLLADEKRRRFGQTAKPRPPRRAASSKPHSRYIPSEVRRQVWRRDGGKCCFHGPDGNRCGARSRLQFHHKIPFELGGPTRTDNLELMCAPHNALLAERDYGRSFILQVRRAKSHARAPHAQNPGHDADPARIANGDTAAKSGAADPRSRNASSTSTKSKGTSISKQLTSALADEQSTRLWALVHPAGAPRKVARLRASRSWSRA